MNSAYGDPPSPPVRVIRLRYSGQCGCGAGLPVGTQGGWDPKEKAVICLRCIEKRATVVPEGGSLPVVETLSDFSLEDRAHREAGASLAAEYERRMARREGRVRQRMPRVGGLLLEIFDEAPSTKAFKKGADGERAAVKRLLRDSGPQVQFLANRRLGKGRRDGDVDVVAVSSGGVLVIDVKRYADAKVRVEREGGLFTPRYDVLKVRGRDQSRLLDGLAKQIDAVTVTLRTDERFTRVPVSGALCFVDADLPLLGRLEARGYSISTPKGTAKALREACGVISPELVEQIALHLDTALPPALSEPT